MSGGKERAFTLLEIVLAIAVMALVAGTIIALSSHLLAAKSASADDIFWKACAAARRSALESEEESRLGFDDKTKSFMVLKGGGGSQSFSVPSATNDLTVNFLTTQAGASSVLIGGALIETETMHTVTFYPDGTCSPFRLQIQLRGNVHIIAIDPWTCAHILPAAEANAAAANL